MTKANALFPNVKNDISFDTLWQQAQETIEALSGTAWSDRGDHDPGITLLQSAAWNCSDLSYRASLSLNDLLTRQEAATLFPEEFGPQNVLTCNTVTAEDYRRALRDLHSKDVAALAAASEAGFLFDDALLIREPEENERYHWWYNSETREYSFTDPEEAENAILMTLRGNNWLYLVPSRYTSALTAADREQVDIFLDEFLKEHRNLGENVSRIIWLEPVEFSPRITLELSEDIKDINNVAAQIYQAASNLLLPAVTRYTTRQLREQGYSHEEIFVGPRLQHGWQQDSGQLISEDGLTINLSPLINQLLEVEGVTAVSQLSVSGLPDEITPSAEGEWIWQVAAGYFPRLWGDDPLEWLASDASPLTLLFKGGIYARPDSDALAAILAPPPLIELQAEVLAAGKFRDLAAYTPVGNRLPECYRLQEPDAAIDNNVRELHQFLLPIDQMLMDGCKTLAIMPELLSFDQRGNSVRGTAWPYKQDSVQEDVHASYDDALIELETRDAAIFTDAFNLKNFYRELDYLQYLLSYFGTHRAAYPLTLDLQDFLDTQRAFLAQQPALGYDRINFRIDRISALQKRIAARIGLGGGSFEDEPGKLPFYLIEHRQLLPVMPDVSFNEKSQPDDFSYVAPLVTLTQSGSKGKIKQGLLIDLIAQEGDSELKVGPLVVVNVNQETFTVSTENSQQLYNDMQRLQDAWASGNLSWKNSSVWLQDMDYPLNYAEEAQQPANSAQRRLVSNAQSPFPSMVNVDDTIILTTRALSAALAGEPETTPPVARDDWQLEAKIVEVNKSNGTLVIEATSGDGSDFPAAEESWRYQWYFSSSAYATSDRFSFVVSIVINRGLIENNPIDPDRLMIWLRQEVMAEFPAHVSLLDQWLEEPAFNDFAATYARWENGGNPLGDDAYKILAMLTLGHLPVAQLGIGLMRIATDEQREAVMGADETEWNTAVILSEELFYIPKE